MKKLFNFLAVITATYLSLVLALSLVLTNEKSLIFFSGLFFPDNLELKVKKSHWHPIKPFLEIDELSFKSEEEYLSSKDIKIYFSLLNPFFEATFLNINIQNLKYSYLQGFEDRKVRSGLSLPTKLINGIQIEQLEILDNEANTILQGQLVGSFSLESPAFNFIGEDGNEGEVIFYLSSKDNSYGNLVDGYIKTTDFLVKPHLLNLFCQKCDGGLILNTEFRFSLFENKPIDLLGNLNIELRNDLLGINSISSSFKLTDTSKREVQVRSFLNQDQDLTISDFLLSYEDSNLEIYIPTLDIRNIQSLLRPAYLKGLGPLDLNGSLNEIRISPFDEDKLISGSFASIDLLSKLLSFKGLGGNFIYTVDNFDIYIDTPYLNLDSKGLFDEVLNIYDFRSQLSINSQDDYIQITRSPFELSINNEIVNGSLSFDASPQNSLGDISIFLNSYSFSKDNAFILFPNTSYLKPSKNYLQNLIQCGKISNPNILLRLPIDRKYEFSSSSFSFIGSSSDLCVDLDGFDINQISVDFAMQDFLFEGQVKEANFYGSNILSNFTLSKENNYSFELEGSAEGPFLSLLRFFNMSEVNSENSSGLHQTKFFYKSPWESINTILHAKSDLIIQSEIKNGSFSFPNFDFSFSNIFSNINYDSEVGIKDGFISLKVNSIPLLFDLEKEKLEIQRNINVFSVVDNISLNKLIPKSFNRNISGNTKTTIKLTVPSFRRDTSIGKAKISLSSNLNGIEMNLPEPFYKGKAKNINLDMTYLPNFEKEISRLNFKYGNKLRGKLNFSNTLKEGFLIAGKEKQSISIEEDTLSMIGSFEKVDFRILELLNLGSAKQNYQFKIKGLNINKPFFQNYSFNKLSLKSIASENFYAFEAFNNQFQGRIFYPKTENFLPFIDLDFIKVDFSSDDSSGSFLTLFNEINTEIRFSSKKVNINSHDYGNWSFTIIPTDDRISFSNLIGKYNKWGLEKTEKAVSDLSIIKKGFGWQTNLVTKIYSGSPEKAFKQIGIEPNFEMDTIAMETDLSWNSLPWKLNYEQIRGGIELDIKGLLINDNQDIQTPNNLLRLINIFNITDSFEKVTNLDFRKLYKSGFAADSVKGALRISESKIVIDDDLSFKSGSSEFKWTGEISKNKRGNLEDINFEVIMTLPLQEYLPAYALILGGPVTAGVVYIAGKAFERNLDKLSSGTWKITGSLENPKTDFEGWFEN